MQNKYKFWRIVGLIAIVFVSVFFILATFSLQGIERKIYLYVLIPVFIFALFTLIHQMRFPLDLRIYIVWVFIFSLMAMAYGSTAVSIMIFYCAYSLGKQINYFKSHKIPKIVILSVLYVLCIACQFRLSKEELMKSLVEFCVSISAIVFMSIIQKHLLKRINKDILEDSQKEDINDYFAQYNFTERDKNMLKEVLSGCKYEEIAINHSLSLSSVKKRLAYLYKLLGVTCQIDFLIKFAPKTANSTKVQ